ncbi:MAG: ABC transporter ATP-binding protein [Lachnospiraceae bacterium]|nr:ABC transporter ATP-binding protein [Lachnospiraceae bacterium]
MKKNERSLREDLSFIFRGMKEFDSILPGQMQMVIFNSFLVALTPYVPVYMSSRMINELAGEQSIKLLTSYILLAITTTLLLTALSSYLKKRIDVGYHQLFTSQEILLNEKGHRLPYVNIEDPEIRGLRDQVSDNSGATGAGMASLYWDMEIMVRNLCSALIGIVLCADIFFMASDREFTGIYGVVNSPYAIFILVGLIAVSVWISAKMTGKLFDVAFEVYSNGARYHRYGNFYTLDYLSDEKAAKDIRIFSQRKLIVEEALNRCYIPFSDGDKREKSASNKYDGIKLLLSALMGGTVYLLIGLKAMSGTVNIGDVVMAYSSVTMMILAFSECSMIFTDLRNNNEHLKRYFQYMTLPEQKDEGELSVGQELVDNPEIRFENVSFHYPESEKDAVHNVSFSIRSGRRIAIVGMNGSGKTTLVKLLCGLYKPTKGQIMLGNHPISDYSYAEYIKLFSVVFQDFRLLAFSLGQNVAASEEYDADRVDKSLRASGFASKLDRLSKGLEQTIYHDYDEDGVELSGGEEQLVAMARAVYKGAAIFVLDEPTAALDPITEHEIYTRLDKVVGDKSTIFISHRLSTCRFCDEIIVMDKGEIVQQGNHDDLVTKPGKYKELWLAQARHYADKMDIS